MSEPGVGRQILDARSPDMSDSEAPATGRRHFVKTNIGWAGSGRPGDPWVMVSWDVEPCECDRPWRHQALA